MDTHRAERAAWRGMLYRCFDQDSAAYRNYGGRGITVCPEWMGSFDAFLSHVGPKPSPEHSLDRIDVNGDYAPGNVRWATRLEQRRNRRDSRLTTIGGRSMALVDWSRESGVPFSTLYNRIRKGIPPEVAILRGDLRRGHIKGARLLPGDVRTARAALAQGESCAAIARSLNVSRSAISLLKRGKTWAAVP